MDLIYASPRLLVLQLRASVLGPSAEARCHGWFVVDPSAGGMAITPGAADAADLSTHGERATRAGERWAPLCPYPSPLQFNSFCFACMFAFGALCVHRACC